MNTHTKIGGAVPAGISQAQFEHHDSGRGSADWPAYLRLLDGIDKSYRD